MNEFDESEKKVNFPKTKMDFIELLIHLPQYVNNGNNGNDDNEDKYSLVLLKASTIISVEAGNEHYSYVHTNNNKVYKAVGNYRTVTNRIFYANQSHAIINMSILKPSDYFYHRVDELAEYADDIYYSIDFMAKLRKVIKSELFTYRGINTFDQ